MTVKEFRKVITEGLNMILPENKQLSEEEVGKMIITNIPHPIGDKRGGDSITMSACEAIREGSKPLFEKNSQAIIDIALAAYKKRTVV